jgi:hypothetical protein
MKPCTYRESIVARQEHRCATEPSDPSRSRPSQASSVRYPSSESALLQRQLEWVSRVRSSALKCQLALAPGSSTHAKRADRAARAAQTPTARPSVCYPRQASHLLPLPPPCPPSNRGNSRRRGQRRRTCLRSSERRAQRACLGRTWPCTSYQGWTRPVQQTRFREGRRTCMCAVVLHEGCRREW